MTEFQATSLFCVVWLLGILAARLYFRPRKSYPNYFERPEVVPMTRVEERLDFVVTRKKLVLLNFEDYAEPPLPGRMIFGREEVSDSGDSMFIELLEETIGEDDDRA